jgi:predicted aconitase
MIDIEDLIIKLTRSEQNILKGNLGPVMQKVMISVVLYGEAMGAKRLVDIEGNGHFVISYAIPGISPSMEMLEELVSADTHTKHPFTLDPKPPLDFENWWLRSAAADVSGAGAL